jgi:RNA polymerase sigma-70 factor, ECF subfamily
VDGDVGFDSMFRAAYRPVLGYCLRRATEAAANDATAEVFTIAWRRRDELPADPIPWLIGVARRVLANQHRSERRRLHLVSRAGRARDASTSVDADASPIHAALAALGPTDQEIVRLAYWDGLTHQQIGEVLAISTNAVGVRLHRARATLRGELARPGDDEEDVRCRTTT